MMTGKFSDNPYYVEYEGLLKQLHRLIAEGKGDSDDADAVREEMDRPERELSREELNRAAPATRLASRPNSLRRSTISTIRVHDSWLSDQPAPPTPLYLARLNGLSADLYMLQDNEFFEPSDPDESTVQRLGAELKAAQDRGDWMGVLDLLRKSPTFMSPDQIAFLRAGAYEALGHLDTSLLFMAYAARLKPLDTFYGWSVMDLLIKARRFDEALARAESQIERSQLTPGLRIQAATVLLTAAKAMPDEQARPVYERAIEVLQPALEASSQLLPVVVVIGHRTLGFCYEALGRAGRLPQRPPGRTG
jgi:hypothetical protein